LISSCIF